MPGDRRDGRDTPMMRGVLSLVLPLFSVACGPTFDDHAGDLPPALACDPTLAIEPDPIDGVSFDASQMLCFGVEMEPGDFDALRRESRMGGDDELEMIGNVLAHVIVDCTTPYPDRFNWYEANVTLAGDTLERVGIRKKGFLGSVVGTGLAKPSLKLNTDKHVSGQRFGTTDSVTLNNGAQDKTRIAQCLAYSVFEAAAYPSPRCNLASVMINQRATGSYAHVETIDKPFLRRAFGNDAGALYEGSVADVSPAFLVEATRGNLGRFEAKTNVTDPMGEPLLRLMRALDVPDEELLSSLELVLDVPRFFTFWALEMLIAHEDGYASNRNNFLIYFDPSAGDRAVFIPWGVDHVFTDEPLFVDGAPGGAPFARGEIARRLSRIPEARAMFDAELTRLLAVAWDEDALLARVDRYADQIRSAEADPDYEQHLTTLRAWIRDRRARFDSHDNTPKGGTTAVSCGDFPITKTLLGLFQKIGFAG